MLKKKLKDRYGTLRNAALQTGVNYYRISQLVNGWLTPRPDELKALSLTLPEITANQKALKRQSNA